MSLAFLSGSFPAALKHDRASPLRGVCEAFAAGGAVQAALLAQAGAEGFEQPLEGEGAFFEVYAGGCRREPLLAGIGSHYWGPSVSFKPWPSCRGAHAYIDTALDLRKDLAAEDIVSVVAGIGPIQEMLARPLPADPCAMSINMASSAFPTRWRSLSSKER